MKIWCPGCEWKPRPSSRWMCSTGCFHHWNTFDTGGVCPRCSKVWDYTQCLSCHNRYPHVDWYHDDGEQQLSADELIDLVADVPVAEPATQALEGTCKGSA